VRKGGTHALLGINASEKRKIDNPEYEYNDGTYKSHIAELDKQIAAL